MNTNTLDYLNVATAKDAEDLAARVGKRLGTAEGKALAGSIGRSIEAAQVTYAALQTGLLARHGVTGDDRPEGCISKTVFAGYFGIRIPGSKEVKPISQSQVTFWITLAEAREAGVDWDSTLMDVLAAKYGAKAKGVSAAMHGVKTVEDVEKVLRKAGVDPETGAKKSSAPKPRTSGQEGTGGDESEGQAAPAPHPVEVALEAVKALEAALRDPKCQAAEFKRVMSALGKAVDREEKRRGVGRYAKDTAAQATG